MPETECPLCKRLLQRPIVIPNVPDFCISCYMERVHPKVEQIMKSAPVGQMPEMVETVKHVLAANR
jgi:hypothetical protein